MFLISVVMVNMGTTTRCKPQLLINTSADCSNIYGGITYDGKTQTCNGQNVIYRCHRKILLSKYGVSNQNVFGSLSLSASVSPNQFICYKDYVGNRLAQSGTTLHTAIRLVIGITLKIF